MTLNNNSYVHVRIRKLCSQLEILTSMRLITDINGDFEELKFVNSLGYITIDWQKKACFTLSHHLNDVELHIAEDLILNLSWLETGKRIRELLKNNV